MYKPRTYRALIRAEGLTPCEVNEGETDLFILAECDIAARARELVLGLRSGIKTFSLKYPRFLTSLDPYDTAKEAPRIARLMSSSGRRAGVGPMASVAGAIAECVGRGLRPYSFEMIIENGGDIFIRSLTKRTIGIYAGEGSPYSGKIALEIGPAPQGIGISTSSGTVSHSLSFGNADAVAITADSAALSDAAATATANRVKSASDVEKAIAFARGIKGVRGVVIIIGDRLGSWGDIRIV